MLNKMLVIGHVGADPIKRIAPSGSPVTSFSLATNRTYTAPNGEREQETEWFKVVAWERLAEVCDRYVSKGRKLYVEGRLNSNTWVGQDGQSRLTNEVVASRVIFLDSFRENSKNGEVSEPGDHGYYDYDFEPDEGEPHLSYEEIQDIVSVDYGYLEDYILDEPDKTYEDFGHPNPTYRDLM